MCVSIKAFSKSCKRNAHHRTTSNWACSWRITVFRWLKKSYEGNFHNFHRFLSPENKDNETNNQKPITLTVRELYELCNPSPHKDAWERGNEILFIFSFRNNYASLLQTVILMHCNVLYLIPSMHFPVGIILFEKMNLKFPAAFAPTVGDVYFQI